MNSIRYSVKVRNHNLNRNSFHKNSYFFTHDSVVGFFVQNVFHKNCTQTCESYCEESLKEFK